MVGLGYSVFALDAGGGHLDIFSLVYHFSFLFPLSLEELDSRARGPKFDTHILLFLLLLIQEGQLSSTGKKVCAWSTG